ncbi:MAG: nitrate ABC transporter permease [Cytophagales bacterium]|nr:nitrate ABC transporter permease [Cytophagales bacterium]
MKTTLRSLKWTIIKISPALYFMCSVIALLTIWQIISINTQGEIPGPASTLIVFEELFLQENPFYDNPDDPGYKGVLAQIISSLGRVFAGFLLGSLVAIPLGLLMGSNTVGLNIFNPIVQVLRPVSPLAWFPLGMIALKSAAGATIFMIFITSLWPTLINTAFGVASIPADYKNVGKAFGFSRWKYITKIMIPFALPHIITGLRLSIGVAWMVIVAGEMLSGGLGIGFFVWDSYNGGSLERVLTAILLIGTIGLALDKVFDVLKAKFSFA